MTAEVGMRGIAAYVPDERHDLVADAGRYGVAPEFLERKTGFLRVARKAPDQECSDLAVAALRRLEQDEPGVLDRLGLLLVVTQNPDNYGLPHTAAVVHGKLRLPVHVAAFDVSLGCSGWVYAVSIAKSFMEANRITHGAIVTADPYSKVIDPGDRDTALLFGDAATATLLTAEAPKWRIGRFDFGTRGAEAAALEISPERVLRMNGRAVFNFAAQQVPCSIRRALDLNGIGLERISRIVLHQGSRYIVETIAERLGAGDRTPFVASDTGNAVSSSIPLVLAGSLADDAGPILVSGFGVGLSWASTVLFAEEG